MMTLTADNIRDIIERRDPRYDGRFYFGVSTTRIYCRPICSARPKPENIRIFRSPTEAEIAGFRPCLRCRPDATPGTTLFDGTVTSVTRALRLIDESGDESLDVASLAERLGMTDRHLRRLFDSHLGASPIEILTSKRLHLARQLIEQTGMPVTGIAFAVGFRSVRRFNEAFRALYRMTPSEMRKAGAVVSDADGLRLSLPVRAPYDWDMLMAYFSRHETYGVERVRDGSYQRFLPTDHGYATLHLRHDAKKSALMVTLRDLPLTQVKAVLSALRHMFDSDHNPAHLPSASPIKPLGVRLPGAFDGFETALSIILGQLVSTTQAKKKTGDLVRRFGRKLGEDAGGEIFAFPGPADLVDQELETLGMTRARADAMRGLSRAVMSGDIMLSPAADLAATRAKILDLRGIGPWTTEMIAMRVLGDPDAFPKNDLVVARALQQAKVDDSAWATARAYLTHCIWRDYATLPKETRS
ncbi:DNA-3-methyladenine glycosylase 2 family protein [Govanella unica]|uniref:DNA-3-methyladenine glycosylase II n=1 Tax=Govanella unica TaxID=2975056 RepID=A0A9X3Z693_9PROT|nr:Ada metal-binding domain-containing protein [Govania unica]MDA5192842.1 helix-turn-helix domain-containing protein [Govania unica]